jgi:hypothetical protein
MDPSRNLGFGGVVLIRPLTAGNSGHGQGSRQPPIQAGGAKERIETLAEDEQIAENCQACSIKSRCTTTKERLLTRWEHETVLEALEARLDRQPERMRGRRQTAEHPLGTLNAWMGHTRFQMKTLKQASTEMSLHVLAYNLKRAMNILSAKPLIRVIQASCWCLPL